MDRSRPFCGKLDNLWGFPNCRHLPMCLRHGSNGSIGRGHHCDQRLINLKLSIACASPFPAHLQCGGDRAGDDRLRVLRFAKRGEDVAGICLDRTRPVKAALRG